MKGANYYVAIATVIFSHVKLSRFGAKDHLVFHWCLCSKAISAISSSHTHAHTLLARNTAEHKHHSHTNIFLTLHTMTTNPA